MEENDQALPGVSISRVQKLMTVVLLPVPRAWLAILGVAVVLSLFELALTADGALTVNFHVTTITAVLLGLVWLPFLLKTIALSGGGIKTMAGEASITGLTELLALLGPEEQRDSLPTLIASVQAAESSATEAEQPKLREVRQELESRLISLSPDAEQARAELQNLVEQYNTTRQGMPTSTERTIRLNSIVAQSKALATQAALEPAQLRKLFAGDGEGARIVALAAVQGRPHPESFEEVLQSIGKSTSAFEQYQALVAMGRLLPKLDAGQKQELARVLEDQRSGGRDKFIKPGTDRWALSSRLLRQIEG